MIVMDRKGERVYFDTIEEAKEWSYCDDESITTAEDLEEWMTKENGGIVAHTFDEVEERKMTKEMMVKIMMADRCTKSEAEAFLKNDSIIWDNYEDYKASCIAALLEEDEIPTLEDIKAGKVEGMSFITFEGQDYIIAYTL